MGKVMQSYGTKLPGAAATTAYPIGVYCDGTYVASSWYSTVVGDRIPLILHTFNGSTWVEVARYSDTSIYGGRIAYDGTYYYLASYRYLYAFQRSGNTFVLKGTYDFNITNWCYGIKCDSLGRIHVNFASDYLYCFTFNGVAFAQTASKTNFTAGTLQCFDVLPNGYLAVANNLTATVLRIMRVDSGTYLDVVTVNEPDFGRSTIVTEDGIWIFGSPSYSANVNLYRYDGTLTSLDTYTNTSIFASASICTDGKYVYVLDRSSYGIFVFSFNGTAIVYNYYVDIAELLNSDGMNNVDIDPNGFVYVCTREPTVGLRVYRNETIAQFTMDKSIGAAPLTIQFTAV